VPHIHIKVTAEGHEELVTQHYPKEGNSRAEFDLILEKSQN
jgi:protocatechuate 3,4-dioxygenase beta subunit